MSLRWTKNNRCYTKYRMKNLCNSYIKLQQSCKQHKLWLKPDSILYYSSSRRLQFSCMLSIMQYSNKLSMRLLSPGSSHLCIANKFKNCYKVRIVLILLSKLCKLWVKPDRTHYYKLSKHQLFDYKLHNQRYLNKVDMKFKWPDNNRQCRKYKHLNFSYTNCSSRYWSMPNKKWRWLNSTHCCKKCRQMNYYTVHIEMRQRYILCKLWLKPDSILHCSSSRRSQLSCMLSIMKYSSKINKNWNLQGNSQYYIACKMQHLNMSSNHFNKFSSRSNLRLSNMNLGKNMLFLYVIARRYQFRCK